METKEILITRLTDKKDNMTSTLSLGEKRQMPFSERWTLCVVTPGPTYGKHRFVPIEFRFTELPGPLA